jgi:hypothetical protein
VVRRTSLTGPRTARDGDRSLNLVRCGAHAAAPDLPGVLTNRPTSIASGNTVLVHQHGEASPGAIAI